jgi:hypothetical protein
MSSLRFIYTKPLETDFNLFHQVLENVYPKELQQISKHKFSQLHLSTCVVLIQNDKPIGRFSFYENPGLRFKDYKVASIGSYECANDSLLAKTLLDEAKKLAKSKGYDYLLGPLEGSTWESFRFSVPSKHPFFFLEPFHHAYYLEQFEQNGFSVASNYVSNLDTQMSFSLDGLEKMEAKLKLNKLTIRNIRLDDLENELLKLAQFSNLVFAQNLLFSPIKEKDFVRKYLTIKPFLDPDLVVFIENENAEIQGIAFAIKDLYDPSGETVVYKTIGRIKGEHLEGLGQYLVAKMNQIASGKGYKKAIQAFMIEDQASVTISESIFRADVYKRHLLYGTAL